VPKSPTGWWVSPYHFGIETLGGTWRLESVGWTKRLMNHPPSNGADIAGVPFGGSSLHRP
jgi:hypothetical protein